MVGTFQTLPAMNTEEVVSRSRVALSLPRPPADSEKTPTKEHSEAFAGEDGNNLQLVNLIRSISELQDQLSRSISASQAETSPFARFNASLSELNSTFAKLLEVKEKAVDALRRPVVENSFPLDNTHNVQIEIVEIINILKSLYLTKDCNRQTSEWIDNQDWKSFGELTEDLETNILRLEFLLSQLPLQEN